MVDFEWYTVRYRVALIPAAPGALLARLFDEIAPHVPRDAGNASA
jgi:hypothetical protein